MSRCTIARTKLESVPIQDPSDLESLGASYSHLKTLKGAVGPRTKRIVAYHAMLTDLSGLEDTECVEQAYLGFNRITGFRPEDTRLRGLGVLDLAGNPITSLLYCPQVDTLIVSATKVPNLKGCPEGIRIIRCGHSDHLVSLEGCPSTVRLIECSCSPNLVIDSSILPAEVELLS